MSAYESEFAVFERTTSSIAPIVAPASTNSHSADESKNASAARANGENLAEARSAPNDGPAESVPSVSFAPAHSESEKSSAGEKGEEQKKAEETEEDEKEEENKEKPFTIQKLVLRNSYKEVRPFRKSIASFERIVKDIAKSSLAVSLRSVEVSMKENGISIGKDTATLIFQKNKLDKIAVNELDLMKKKVKNRVS